MLLPQCKKVFACKVKTANLFSLQLQQNFLVQQCFLPLFFLFCRRILLKPSYGGCGGAITCTNILSPFPSSDFTQTVLQQLRWCNYLYKHDCAQVFSAVFPCILHFTTKKTFFDKICRFNFACKNLFASTVRHAVRNHVCTSNCTTATVVRRFE